jgi:hypothetical protein
VWFVLALTAAVTAVYLPVWRAGFIWDDDRHLPDYAEAHYDPGVAYLQTGTVAPASAQFRKALEIRPDYAEVRSNLEAIGARPR